LLQQLKTARFVLSGMRERIVRSLTHARIISRGTSAARCARLPGKDG